MEDTALRLTTLALATILAVAGGTATAQTAFPERPLRLVVGFAPGGIGDIISRLLADTVSVQPESQRVVVENRTGANGMIALEAVARGQADGYTVFQCSTGIMTVSPEMPGLRLPIDIGRDVAPIANVARNSWALAVAPQTPYRSVAELVAAARARPGGLTYGHAGVGSLQHLAVEWFRSEAKLDLLGVTYRGMGPAITDLMTGRIDMVLTSLADVSRQAQDGQVRLLALADSEGSPQFPDAPQISATLPGFELLGWSGLCGPRGLPADTIAWWQAAVSRALEQPAMRERLGQLGMRPGYEDAAQFTRTIAAGRERWRAVIRAAGIKAE